MLMRRRSGSARRGLVLGAGGYLGAAWTLGALAAVQGATGWDVTEADVMVGTSAGSVLTMLLRAGLSVDELCAAQLGRPSDAVAALGTDDATEEPDGPVPDLGLDHAPRWPGLPRPGLGSPSLLARALRDPLGMSPAGWCAALLPRGRHRLDTIAGVVGDLHPRWPAGTRVVTTDLRDGTRVVCGPDGVPVDPSAAVTASCAVPGWHEPVDLDGVPHVDGAVYSPCNVDLAADCAEVWVLAPMASLAPDRPLRPVARLERWWRRLATQQTVAEARRLEAAGVRVHLLTPDADDLAVMGVNMMDGRRRARVLRTAMDRTAARLAAGAPSSQLDPVPPRGTGPAPLTPAA
jgi:NTE family protein